MMFVALVERHTLISVVTEVGEVTTVVIMKTWLSGAMVSKFCDQKKITDPNSLV